MLKRKWSNKQYCGDVESNPFEFAYRGSVFDPYKKDSNKVPTVEEQSRLSAAAADAEDLIEDIPLPAHRLSAKVRQQYLYYLERVLRKNYHTWLSSYSGHPGDNPFSDGELRQCAETIEMRAVQSCMITSLYQNFILQKIGEIRKQTTLGLIHPNLTDVKFQPAYVKREQCHVGVQTDCGEASESFAFPNATVPMLNLPEISLEEKMELFHRKHSTSEHSSYAESSTKRSVQKHEPIAHTTPVQMSNSVPLTVDGPTGSMMEGPRPRNDAMDDAILKELQAMFEPADEDEVNIFEWSEDQAQVKAIINEIESVEPTQAQGQYGSSRAAPASPALDRKALLPDRSPRVGPGAQQPPDLRCSMWPCELHRQRMRLRNLLVKLAEDNYRRYERLVQTQFVTLFGADDGEEQDLGPYSPSIELNEVLVSSCRQRIAKWVVQALMRPLNDGLIGNRFLFKKLAKRLADGIIYQNQYPDKKFIRKYVDEYFCSHAQIKSIEDII
ncbi:AGAP012993-PA [Anopheles gambiae str. PEST]|uniref:AGAP012993-PA n=1 Tax=Anopheles gambiae TaxID=7165 RepID=F5HL99_ANOGA|nr:AGAP012993-PA [Anopheles gambiae str. PEST]